MSDKDSQGESRQLTVAELLARSGGSQPAKGSRRRHRSLSEGGVSVAELTGNLPKVAEKPEESRHSSVPIDEDPAPAGGPESAAALDEQPAEQKAGAEEAEPPATSDAAGERGVANDPDAAPEDSADDDSDAAGEDDADDDQSVGAPEGDAEELEESTGDGGDEDLPDATAVLPAVAEKEPAENRSHPEDVHPQEAEREASGAGSGPAEDGGGPDSQDAWEKDPGAEAQEADDSGSSGIASVIFLAVVGVVVGAVVFLGFQQLWESHLSRIITAILALAVTGLFVGIAHALRTTRDGLSMALAGLVGLLMTFGPFVPLLL